MSKEGVTTSIQLLNFTKEKYMIYSYINGDLVNNFYYQIFNFTNWCHCEVIPLLKSYCSLKGNAISEEETCYFSPEWKDYGLEYFGEDKVLFDFQAPAVDEDKQIVILYQDFYDIVYKYYSEYARQHSDEQAEIMQLLNELKNKLNVK